MTKRPLILLFFALALLAPAAAARAGAFAELAGDPTASGWRASAAAPALSTAAALPDDTVREDPPGTPEVLPVPAPGPAVTIPDADAIDPQHLIPAGLKAEALAYLRANAALFSNVRYLGIVDFSKHSSLARFYIADTAEGKVKVIHVAHGSGSDPDGDGFATIFSNKPNSNASSLGAYLTGEIYTGKHGRSMRLHGLSETNSNAFQRAVVVHSAKYVSDSNVQPGRSWGCLAVSEAALGRVIEALQGGAFIYAGLSGPQ